MARGVARGVVCGVWYVAYGACGVVRGMARGVACGAWRGAHEVEVLRDVGAEAVEGAHVRVQREEAAVTLGEQGAPARLPRQPALGLGEHRSLRPPPPLILRPPLTVAPLLAPPPEELLAHALAELLAAARLIAAHLAAHTIEATALARQGRTRRGTLPGRIQLVARGQHSVRRRERIRSIPAAEPHAHVP